MDGQGETSIPLYNFVAGGIIKKNQKTPLLVMMKLLNLLLL